MIAYFNLMLQQTYQALRAALACQSHHVWIFSSRYQPIWRGTGMATVLAAAGHISRWWLAFLRPAAVFWASSPVALMHRRWVFIFLQKPSLLLKAALLALMITCNTVGCTFFVKALNGSGSSLPVTVASAATNYVCSALVGFAVFDESTSLLWWCGTSLVLLGLALTCYVPVEKGTSAVETRLKQQ
ncbi:hypothetical protein EAI_15952 [Harpegnathos saltator]|uniref:Transmembrane protein 42 n=1 Tax=Harpegnathos saltator TaxID=610380 RepID=E2B8S3_HARSA|nr:hypothetical protein EAI_15952 [Harpegnathos saltator]